MPTIKDAYIFDDLDNSDFKASRQIIKDFEDKFIKEAQAETGTITIDDKIQSKMYDFKSNMSQILNYLDEILSFSGITDADVRQSKKTKKGGFFINNQYHGGAIIPKILKEKFNLFDKIQSLEGDRHYKDDNHYKYQPFNVLYGGAPPGTAAPDPLSASTVQAIAGLPLPPGLQAEEVEVDDQDPSIFEAVSAPPTPTPIDVVPQDESSLNSMKEFFTRVYTGLGVKLLQKILNLKSTSEKTLINAIVQKVLEPDTEADLLSLNSAIRRILSLEPGALDILDGLEKKYKLDPEEEYVKSASRYNPLLQTITKINNIIDKTTSNLKSMLGYSKHLDLEDTDEINSILSEIKDRATVIQDLLSKNVFDPATNRTLMNMIQKINSILVIGGKLTGFYGFDVAVSEPTLMNVPINEEQVKQTKEEIEARRMDSDIKQKELDMDKVKYERRQEDYERISIILNDELRELLDNIDEVRAESNSEKTEKAFEKAFLKLKEADEADIQILGKPREQYIALRKILIDGRKTMLASILRENKLKAEKAEREALALQKLRVRKRSEAQALATAQPEAQPTQPGAQPEASPPNTIKVGTRGYTAKLPENPVGEPISYVADGDGADSKFLLKGKLGKAGVKNVSQMNVPELQQVINEYNKRVQPPLPKPPPPPKKKGSGFFDDFGRGFKQGFSGASDIMTGVITANPEKWKEGMAQITAGSIKKRRCKGGNIKTIESGRFTPAQKQIITKYLL